MWKRLRQVVRIVAQPSPQPLSRDKAARLISELPIIENIAPSSDGPDLRSARARQAWNMAADRLAAGGPDIADWHFDALIACGRFEEALKAAPLIEGGRSSVRASKILALKLHMGLPPASPETIGLFGPRLTKFGKENLPAVTQYVTIQLEAEPDGRNLIETWAGDAHENPHGMPLFGGHPSYLIVKPPRGLSFDRSPSAESYCLKLLRDAENAWREEQGIPFVGQGWVAETRLYYEIKGAFPEVEVEQHARPDWLRPQHLDIYIPALATALEYQGAQHDQPIAFFGGEAAFLKTQERDRRKQRRCKRNGVRLIYVREGYLLADVIEEVRAGR